jgi:hypothetical protein
MSAKRQRGMGPVVGSNHSNTTTARNTLQEYRQHAIYSVMTGEINE